MSLKKALVSGAAALALVGTAASAIQIEKDGTGDYLISPVYITGGNWETKIKVVNTNTTAAVIAKVIVREGTLSQELVDFPLFLTPGDVFEARLYADESGNIHITSDDDSVIVKLDGTPGIDIDLTKNANLIKSNGESAGRNFNCVDEKKGYIEIIGLANVPEDMLKEWDSNWSAPCPYSKEILFNKTKTEEQTSLSLGAYGDVSNSDLMGQQILYRNDENRNGRRAMFLNMLAFGDTFSESVDGENVLGPDRNINVLKPGTRDALLSELAKTHVYVPYEGNSQYKADPFLTIFTYPYWKNAADCNSTLSYTLDENTTIFRDLSENSAYCDPVACDGNISTGNEGGELVSGPTEPGTPPPTCPTYTFKKEVEIIFFHDPETVNENGESMVDPWANKYLFSAGGYIDIDLSAITTPAGKGLPVIPTTFYSKKVGDLYLNNHLYNQYLQEK